MRRAGCDVPEWMLLLRRGRAKPVTACITERQAYEKRAAAHKKQIVQQSKVRRETQWCPPMCWVACGHFRNTTHAQPSSLCNLVQAKRDRENSSDAYVDQGGKQGEAAGRQGSNKVKRARAKT